MTALNLKIGSIVKGSFLKSSVGIVTSVTDKQIVFTQNHNSVQVVSNLASGRVLHLKQTVKKISVANMQKILDGKIEYTTAEIVSI